jgi:hypothetical protein
VAVATGVGFGVGFGVAVGFGFGVGVAVAFGLGVRVGRGEEKTGGGVLLEGNGRVGENVCVVTGLEGEGVVTLGGELTGTTGRGVLAGGTLAVVASGTDAFGTGDAIEIGVVAGVSAGRSDRDSNGLGRGVVASKGSGAAVSSGLTVALGLAIALAVGLGRGEGDGDGDSTAAAGLLCRNGVDAASCARTRAAVTKNTIARTNERMMVIRFLAGFVCRR